MSNELAFLLNFDEDELTQKEGVDAWLEAIRFWLDTPEGSVWGRPEWGNPLVDFKFEDMSTDTEVEFKLDMLSALRRDLPYIPVSGIDVQFSNIDHYTYYVLVKDQVIEKQVGEES